MKQLRLLFLVREPFPTFRSDVVTLFGKYLPQFGVASDYVAERNRDEPAAEWAGGRTVLSAAGGSPLRRQWRKFRHNIRVLLNVSDSEYDAIQVRDMAFTALVAMIVARMRKIPLVYWMSFPMCDAQIERARRETFRAGLGYAYPLLQGMLGKVVLNKVVLKRADHIFVQSETMRKQVADGGVPADRITPVPMGVDFEAVMECASPLSRPELSRERVIVHLGVLEASRQSCILLELLSLVRRVVPDARLLCIGSAESKGFLEEFERTANRLGIWDAVTITGWLPQAEAWAQMQHAEVGLSLIPLDPLYIVASPTKLVECLAFGVPMVVNTHPDQQLVIENSGAGYCVEWSAHDLAQAVVALLVDEGKRQEMSAAGRKYVAQHRSYRSIAAKVAQKFHEIVERHQQERRSLISGQS